jgi:hypothetical protein
VVIFASAVTDPELFERAAAAGVRRLQADEPDAELVVFASVGSIFRNYNLILNQIRQRDDIDDVDALVLIHQDAEISDPQFTTKLRAALADPGVAIVGCAGAVDVRSIAWWEGSITWASFTHRYEELGGGEQPALTWDTDDLPAFARTGEVDTVDGFVMVLSPWVVRNVRFDESLGQLHGYDFDFCLSVRAAGKRVHTADFRVVHHHSLDLVSNPETWLAAHERLAEKWAGRMPGVKEPEGDWKARARRAEAEASLARTQAVAAMMHADARLAQLQRDLDVTTESLSWRITAPLRRANAYRRGRRTS